MGYNWIDGVLANSAARLTDLLVLIAIAQKADRDSGECYPAVETIAATVKISRIQVQRSLRSLEQLGEISTIKQASRYGTNLYRLNRSLLGVEGQQIGPIDQIEGQQIGPVSVEGQQIGPAGATNTPPDATNMLPKQVILNKSINEKNFSLPRGPIFERSDVSDLADERTAVFDAYAAAAEIGPKSAQWARAKNESIEILGYTQSNGTMPAPDQIAALTRYTIAKLRAGGIHYVPSVAKVLDRETEFGFWKQQFRTAYGRDPTAPDDFNWTAPAPNVSRETTRRQPRGSTARGLITADDRGGWDSPELAKYKKGKPE